MSASQKKAAKVATRTADERLKWLTWPEFLQLVEALKHEIAGRDGLGRKRTPAMVAWSLQRYLLFGILSCIPGAILLPIDYTFPGFWTFYRCFHMMNILDHG